MPGPQGVSMRRARKEKSQNANYRNANSPYNRRDGGDQVKPCCLKSLKDWPSLFEQNLNAGDLEAVMTLYEPDACFVARFGELVVGRDRICDQLAGMIRSKTRLQSRVIKAITVDDVARLYIDFQGAAVDASGKTIEVCHKAIEVLHRQSDGAWKLIVGDPNARE
jgi:uncharacterized protein (TIGR02246 family)